MAPRWTALLLVAACGDSGPSTVRDAGAADALPGPGNLLLLLRQTDAFGFEAAVRDVGLESRLSAPEPLTVFAPAGMSEAPEDPVLLENWVLHHLVEGVVPAGLALRGGPLPTLAGTTIESDPERASFDGAALSSVFDVAADNGVLHRLDRWMRPPSVLDALEAPEHERFLELLRSVPSVAAALEAGGVTVLAPPPSALSGIEPGDEAALGGHILVGVFPRSGLAGPLPSLAGAITATATQDRVEIGGASVLGPELRLSDGVLHPVDGLVSR